MQSLILPDVEIPHFTHAAGLRTDGTLLPLTDMTICSAAYDRDKNNGLWWWNVGFELKSVSLLTVGLDN